MLDLIIDYANSCAEYLAESYDDDKRVYTFTVTLYECRSVRKS